MDAIAARLPVRFCTYPALISSSILTEGPKGPVMGELLYPVTTEQCGEDHCAGCTRVGFSYIAPPVEEQASWVRWEQRETPFGVGVFPVPNNPEGASA